MESNNFEETVMAKTFEIVYQAAGAATGKDVQVDVYKPDKTLDATQSGLATEIGTTGRYYKSFDADAPGWFCEISDEDGGKAVQHFGKRRWDGHGVADAVADVQTAVDAVAVAIATLDATVTGMDGKVDTIGTDVTALGTQLTDVQAAVAALTAPPMMG
jgi:hypothetical protein